MALIRRVRLETLTRVVADALMINVAFLTALASRFLLLFTLWDGQSEESVRFYAAIWQESLRLYRNSAWLLTLICLAVFYASGFYTYGRAYRSRYKALIVFQAVGLSYLSFGFLSYFLRPIPPFPRGALVGSWLLTLVLVGGMRAGAALWARIFWAEARRDMPRLAMYWSLAVQATSAPSSSVGSSTEAITSPCWTRSFTAITVFESSAADPGSTSFATTHGTSKPSSVPCNTPTRSCISEHSWGIPPVPSTSA